MPLHTQQEGMLSVLHSLCNFVRGAGADSQAGPWNADGLVMTAVYGKRLLSDDPVQKASRKDGNPVGGKVGRIGLAVADTAFGAVGGKILPQCSAKTDIDHLCAPADTEYRFLNPEKGVQERKLRLIADRGNKAAAGSGLLAKEGGVRIRPSGEKKSVQPVGKGDCLRGV